VCILLYIRKKSKLYSIKKNDLFDCVLMSVAGIGISVSVLISPIQDLSILVVTVGTSIMSIIMMWATHNKRVTNMKKLCTVYATAEDMMSSDRIKVRYFSKKKIQQIISENLAKKKKFKEVHIKLKEVDVEQMQGGWGDLGTIDFFVTCTDKTVLGHKICVNYIPIWRDGHYLDTRLVVHNRWDQEQNQWEVEDDHFIVNFVNWFPTHLTPVVRFVFPPFLGHRYVDYECYSEEEIPVEEIHPKMEPTDEERSLIMKDIADEFKKL